MQAGDYFLVILGLLLALLTLRLFYCVWRARSWRQAIAGLLAGTGFAVFAGVLFQISFADMHSGCGCQASVSEFPGAIAFWTSIALIALATLSWHGEQRRSAA